MDDELVRAIAAAIRAGRKREPPNPRSKRSIHGVPKDPSRKILYLRNRILATLGPTASMPVPNYSLGRRVNDGS